MTALPFVTLTTANVARCTRSWRMSLSNWSRADWHIATGGELGEALNVVKKLNRDAGGYAGNTVSRDELLRMLADELADVVIYLDLFAASLNHPLATVGRAADFGTLRETVHKNTEHRVGLSERGRLALTAMGELCKDHRHDAWPQSIWILLLRIDAIAAEAEIDLGAAVIAKFNRTSEKLGFADRIEL